jgi:hypothetical protein
MHVHGTVQGWDNPAVLKIIPLGQFFPKHVEEALVTAASALELVDVIEEDGTDAVALSALGLVV